MSGRSLAFLVLLAGACTAAWVSLDAVPVFARAWTVILLIALPAWTLRQAAALRGIDELPRLPVYVSSIVALAGLATLTAIAAGSAGMLGAGLGLITAGLPTTLAWAAGTTVACVVYVFVCHALGARETPTTLQLLPRTRPERVGFAALSLAAGVFEEFVYRGFLIAALDLGTGSATAAMLVSAAAFGLVHGYQAPGGIARAAVLGMLLTAPFLATGSLLPGVIAHAAYDILLGLVFADRLRD